jgi:hypothetical protein
LDSPEVPQLIRRLLEAAGGSNPTQTRGVVVEDRDLQVGEQLVVEARTNPVRLAEVFDGPSVSLVSPETFHGTVLALGFRHNEFEELIGSAVMVAPGLALTAMHSVIAYEAALCAGAAFPFLISTGHHLQAWAVHQIYEVGGTDLALLAVKPLTALPPDRVVRVQSMSTRVPYIGERVFLVGYRATTAANTSDGATSFSASLIATSGEVATHHLGGRDQYLMPWPCFEVQAPTWGGMSGGPVLDSVGRLVGLVCSSIEAEDNLGPAYVSLLWPALVHPFLGAWPIQVYQSVQTLLAMPIGCSIDGREALFPSSDMTTRKPLWSFEPW